MADKAIRPNFYQEFTTDVEKISEEEEVNENQQALAYITRYKGWTLLLEYKERLEEYLDEMIMQAMENGAGVEEIGQRTIATNLTKFVLNNFVRKAEDARKAEDK